MMRLVSMVPSWTETLLECGLNVAGRTRYCIHPKSIVDPIAVVGGTKDISWEKIKALNADLLILDQEENPKKFADQATLPWWSSHVENLSSVPRDLENLNAQLNSEKIKKVIDRWQKLSPLPKFPWNEFPGIIKWWRQPVDSWQPEQILYLVWRNPWMAVSKDTFIGSMMSFLKADLPKFEAKYPKIDLAQYDPQKTLLLFSSEPYSFAQHERELTNLPFHSALIDGEKFSWFGVRSLSFLESLKKHR